MTIRVIKNKTIYSAVIIFLFILCWSMPIHATTTTYENKASIRFYPADGSLITDQEELKDSAHDTQDFPATGEKKQNGMIFGMFLLSGAIFIITKKYSYTKQ
ncbi:LPXTG cell wall anchor domain-containing protein [Enterococcus lactis]|uniref:LPXTG cell wall anchor domain-containing protein n=1 Tax=Enterococcus lactis TaxID=357441 RepID=UPI0039A4BEB8